MASRTRMRLSQDWRRFVNLAVITSLISGLTACATLLPDTVTPVTIVTPDQQQLTGSLVYVLQQGLGKNRISRLVISQLDGSHAKVLTQVNGTLSNLSASGDGKTLIFTEQQDSFPAIFTYDLTVQQKTLITPQRANHFSGSLSPDNQKILIASSMNQNPEIFVMNKDGTDLQQLTHHTSVDIAPSWSPDQRWFVFTSDRTGLYHPQLYRYDFASQQVSRIATTGGYNANAKISPTGDTISYIRKLSGGMWRVLKQLDTGKTWTISDDEMTEAINFSPDGRYGVYSKKYAAEIARLPQVGNTTESIVPIYRLTLNQIKLPASDKQGAIMREPIWLKQ